MHHHHYRGVSGRPLGIGAGHEGEHATQRKAESARFPYLAERTRRLYARSQQLSFLIAVGGVHVVYGARRVAHLCLVDAVRMRGTEVSAAIMSSFRSVTLPH